MAEPRSSGYNPFLAGDSAFADPLCRLTLLETADFVRALPNTTSTTNNNSTGNSSAERQSREAALGPRPELAPRTPARSALDYLVRRTVPSKWDDADKWLVSSGGSSCRASPAHAARPNKPRRSQPPPPPALFSSPEDTLKDKLTEMVEIVSSLAPVQCRRDAGTEMTPQGTHPNSRSSTPFKAPSPARHNTPADRSGPIPAPLPGPSADLSEIKDGHFVSLVFDSKWSSREEEEEELSKSLRLFDIADVSQSPAAAAWEDEEKICGRYQREEAKIQAWVNLQRARAEAESRKLEVKIQKMRSKVEEKLMRKMAVVSRKAEEWRAAAQLLHAQDMARAAERARRAKAARAGPGACGCIPPNYITPHL